MVLNKIKPLKFFWILMALFLLNISVDTTGLFADSVPYQHLIINDQESIIEIVVEQFLGFDSFIPETADDDTNQTANLKKAKVIDIFILPNFALPTALTTLHHKKAEVVTNDNQSDKFHFKIPSPPPEV